MLHLYEYEGCPFCRQVRQALDQLALDCVVFPCPRGGQRFREQAAMIGGRQQFPLLVDPTMGIVQYESRDIVRYLESRTDPVAEHAAVATLGDIAADELADLSGLKIAGRDGRMPPTRLFELYAHENDASARQVRLVLGMLELAYVRRSPAVLAAQRDTMPDWVRRSAPGTIDAADAVEPVLVDPNTQTASFGAGDIAAHLERHY